MGKNRKFFEMSRHNCLWLSDIPLQIFQSGLVEFSTVCEFVSCILRWAWNEDFEIFQSDIITHNLCIDSIVLLNWPNRSGHCSGLPSNEDNFHTGKGPFWLSVKISARSWLVIDLLSEHVIGPEFSSHFYMAPLTVSNR